MDLDFSVHTLSDTFFSQTTFTLSYFYFSLSVPRALSWLLLVSFIHTLPLGPIDDGLCFIAERSIGASLLDPSTKFNSKSKRQFIKSKHTIMRDNMCLYFKFVLMARLLRCPTLVRTFFRLMLHWLMSTSSVIDVRMIVDHPISSAVHSLCSCTLSYAYVCCLCCSCLFWLWTAWLLFFVIWHI